MCSCVCVCVCVCLLISQRVNEGDVVTPVLSWQLISLPHDQAGICGSGCEQCAQTHAYCKSVCVCVCVCVRVHSHGSCSAAVWKHTSSHIFLTPQLLFFIQYVSPAANRFWFSGLLIVHPSDDWRRGQAPRGRNWRMCGGEGRNVGSSDVEKWGGREVREGEGQEIKEKEKMERRRRGEEWKVEGVKKCPVRTHRRPMNLNCGISGIQTQSPSGNYQRGEGGEGGRLQAKNVKRTVHAASVLSVRCTSWADFLMFNSDKIKSNKTKKISCCCCFLSAREKIWFKTGRTVQKAFCYTLHTRCGPSKQNLFQLLIFCILSHLFKPRHICRYLTVSANSLWRYSSLWGGK